MPINHLRLHLTLIEAQRSGTSPELDDVGALLSKLTLMEHYFRSSRCRSTLSTFTGRSTQSGRWRWRDESVDVIEHLKRISVRQRHPDDGVYHLPEIGSFTLSPPSGRISKRKGKRREGRAGDKEREGKGELSSPAILEDGRGEGSLSKLSSTFTSLERTSMTTMTTLIHSFIHQLTQF